jgi:hypothetical protein
MQLWRQGRVRAVERVDDAATADALVLEHLEHLGCDRATPRECRHYVYVRTERGAQTVARGIAASAGWHAGVETAGRCWLVTASVVTALDDDVVRDTRTWLQLLAAEHGGAYDGWEAAAD